jgi:hypothetical protein
VIQSNNDCDVVLGGDFNVDYYVKNHSSVYCTVLDASKAFDRVNFCKAFGLLVMRGLPASIIRSLIKLYTDNQVRVLWAGITSIIL